MSRVRCTCTLHAITPTDRLTVQSLAQAVERVMRVSMQAMCPLRSFVIVTSTSSPALSHWPTVSDSVGATFDDVLVTCYLWPWLGPPLTAVRLCYVLPVLWMTSCFRIKRNRLESKKTRVFRPVRQVAAPGRSLPSATASCLWSEIKIWVNSLGHIMWLVKWNRSVRTELWIEK